MTMKMALDDCFDFGETWERHVIDARKGLEESMTRLSWSREQILQHQATRLAQVIKHAKGHSSYYQKILANVDPTKLVASNLNEFLLKLPVLTKDTVMEHWDDISTDPRLNLQDALQHMDRLAAGQVANPYFLDQYLIFATGGTSGKRGVFCWDWDLVCDSVQVCTRWEKWHELHDNDSNNTAPSKRTALIASGSKAHVTGAVFPMIPKIDPERELKMVTVGLPLSELIQALNDYQPDRLMAYASVIEQLANAQIQGELKIHLNWIFSMAEPLQDSARQAAWQAWGCHICNGYGTTETGAIAIDGPNADGMIVCEDSVILEVVNEKHQQDPRGDRILITPLYGKNFPLLRYEATDTIILNAPPNKGPAPNYHRIECIQGRSDVWFEYKGGIKVPPLVFWKVLLAFQNIMEYQVRQNERGAGVFVIAKGPVETDKIVQKLNDALVQAGLDDPKVEVTVVENLPRHPATNKLKRFVPL